MRAKHALSFLTGLALWAIAGSTHAATGNLKVVMKNQSGHPVNGTVKAIQGSTTKTCNTAAGKCTIADIQIGTWSVSGKSFGGLKDGPYNANVQSGKTVLVELVVKEKSSEKKDAIDKKKKKDSDTTPVDGSTNKNGKSPGNKTRDLSKGKVLRAVGNVRDSKDRTVSAIITIMQNNAVKGKTSAKDGTFKVKDIPPGTYVFEMKSTKGQKKTKPVKIESTSVTVVNFKI